MRKCFNILTLVCYVTILSSCIPPDISTDGGSYQDKAYYTTCNILYENPMEILSTSYLKGTIIPAGTKVTIHSVSDEERPSRIGSINFTVDKTGQPYTLVLVRRHSDSTITTQQYFEQYFSEQNVMDPTGLFHTFSKMEKDNIEKGHFENGMSKNAVLMSIGYPPSLETSSVDKDIWYYYPTNENDETTKISVHWENDKLVKIMGIPEAVRTPWGAPTPDDKTVVVAVADFENLVGKKEDDWLKVGIPELMTTFFDTINGIGIVERASIKKDLPNEKITDEMASKAGRLAGATHIILGSYKMHAEQLSVNARMLETETGKILRAEHETGSIEDTGSVIGALVSKMAGAIGRPVNEAEKRLLAEQGANMMKVIEGLSKGQLARSRGDLDGARKFYEEALKNDPTNEAVLQHIKDIDVELKAIAIVDFKNYSKDKGFDHLSNAIPEELTTLMIQKTALPFAERRNIQKAIDELNLGKTDMIDKETAPKAGELAGATQLMVGSFSVVDKNITINTRLIDTETGNIIGSENVNGLVKDIQALEEKLVDQLLSQLSKVRVVEMRLPKKPATETEAQDWIRKAKKALQDAEEAGAKNISPTIYAYVEDLISQADKAFVKKNYNEARENAYKGEAKARELTKFANEVNGGVENVELVLDESIIGFEYNSDRLKESSLPILNEIANVLKKFPKYRVIIIGHTDSKGTTEYNQDLSERRAKNVLNYMKDRGVNSNMTPVGYGEDLPLADNGTPEGRAKNRRVEFRLLK